MCNQPWGESSRGKVTLAYLYISVSGVGRAKRENRSGLLSHTSHLRPPEPSFVPFHNPHSRRLCLQPILPERVRGRRAGPGVTCICKQIRHTLCYRKGQRGKSAFWTGFGSYQAALFYFHWVWLAKETLWYSHSCASLVGGKILWGLPLLFKASSALCFPVWKQMELKSFKMLCCNHTVFPHLGSVHSP